MGSSVGKESAGRKSGGFPGVGLVLLLAAGLMAGLLAAGGKGGPSFSDENNAPVKIIFQGTRIVSSHNSGVRIERNRVRITKAGTYVLRGKLEDGQIIVDAGKEAEVVLKLNNLTAHCEDSAPLWVKTAGKVKIKLKDESENYFSDGTYYEKEDDDEPQPKACIDARCDLNIKGDKGSLMVTAAFRDGIYSSDDLKIKSGNLKVTAVRDALRSKDSIRIEKGELDLAGGRDGIHTDGYLYIAGGHAGIDAVRYGLYAFEEIRAKSPAVLTVQPPQSGVGCKGPIVIEDGVWKDREESGNPVNPNQVSKSELKE